MYNKELGDLKSIPVQESKRMCTDCLCTIIGAVFALSLFVLSFLMFQSANYQRVNFPTDDSGKVCKLDTPNYPLVYFTDVTDISKGRICVSNCPAAGQPLLCASCPTTLASYSTQVEINRLGGYCQPADHTLNDRLWQNPQLDNKYSLINGYRVLILTAIIGVLLGLLFLSIQMCCPLAMGVWTFLPAVLILIGAAVYLFIGPLQTNFNILIAVGFIIAAALLLIYFIVYRKEIELGAIFLHNAAICLRQNSFAFWVLPVYTLMGLGLLVLCLWQFIAFGSSSDSTYTPGDLYYKTQPNILLQILNLVQFIWGVQFLRDSLNFIVSGYAVDHYFKSNTQSRTLCGKPCRLLLLRHWGSVVGGSFLNAFFILPALLYDLFRCDPRGSCGCCQSCYRSICCGDSLLELVRTDAYAYINLTGVSYCDAARQCQALCGYSDLYFSRQSCLRLYRLASNALLISLITLISYLILALRVQKTVGIILLLIVLTAYVTISPFVEILPATADGLHISYLLEDNYAANEGMRICPHGLQKDVDNFRVKNNIL